MEKAHQLLNTLAWTRHFGKYQEETMWGQYTLLPVIDLFCMRKKNQWLCHCWSPMRTHAVGSWHVCVWLKNLEDVMWPKRPVMDHCWQEWALCTQEGVLPGKEKKLPLNVKPHQGYLSPEENHWGLTFYWDLESVFKKWRSCSFCCGKNGAANMRHCFPQINYDGHPCKECSPEVLKWGMVIVLKIISVISECLFKWHLVAHFYLERPESINHFRPKL